MPAEGVPTQFGFATHLFGLQIFISSDAEGSDICEVGRIGNRPLGLLEPTWIQLKDGRIVILTRAELGGFLWRAESRNNGQTWTDAWQTDIPNPTSLASLVRLPDGRIALVHNANGGVVGEAAARDPMSVWISDDELDIWYIKADVIHATPGPGFSGNLSYPVAQILDGKLTFGYDHNRRQMRFVEVDVPPPRS